MARQENLETIHRHNVVAERYGTLADLRAELAGGEHQAPPHDDARVAGGRLARLSAFAAARVSRSANRLRSPKK